MGTQIRAWQVVDGKLKPIDTSLKEEGRTEPYDLEPWVSSNPEILGSDIAVIGTEVASSSGKIDLLGIDRSGNAVVVELKRDTVPREALAQAIDYASDVSDWTVEKLSEVCSEGCGQTLEELFAERFPEVDAENLNINSEQRIILVGFGVESSLERMIEWLSDSFGVNINAVVLSYFKTGRGEELLAKTSIISEELEKSRVQKRKRFQIPMSDEPGTYDEGELRKLLKEYLKKPAVTNQRIGHALLPALLKKKVVTREQLKQELIDYDPSIDPAKVGYTLTPLSGQLGMKKNDFLRQVISYEYPKYEWEKDNFSLREQYRDLIEAVLAEMEAETDSDE